MLNHTIFTNNIIKLYGCVTYGLDLIKLVIAAWSISAELKKTVLGQMKKTKHIWLFHLEITCKKRKKDQKRVYRVPRPTKMYWSCNFPFTYQRKRSI